MGRGPREFLRHALGAGAPGPGRRQGHPLRRGCPGRGQTAPDPGRGWGLRLHPAALPGRTEPPPLCPGHGFPGGDHPPDGHRPKRTDRGAPVRLLGGKRRTGNGIRRPAGRVPGRTSSATLSSPTGAGIACPVGSGHIVSLRADIDRFPCLLLE